MEIRLALKEAGLSGNEIKVYLSLLDLGSALAGEITKKSGINRTNVYDTLERLMEKGLVSYVVKANRKSFEATTPDNIIEFLESKEKEFKKKKEIIRSLLPELEAKRKLSKEPQEATIYKGIKGWKSIAEDVLKTKKELVAYGAEGRFMEKLAHYADQWHVRRQKLKIPIRIIYNEKLRKEKSKLPFKQIRFNANLYDTPATTWIYGNKVAITVGSDPILAMLIRSKEVAKSYKQFFNILWENSKV